MGLLDGVKRAWNAFTNSNQQPPDISYGTGSSTTYLGGSGPSRTVLRVYSDRSIVSSIYSKISMDVADSIMKHVKVDEQKRYRDDVDSSFNTCLTLEPNIDQGPRAFRQDIVMTLFDRGVAAIVPVDTAIAPGENGFTDIFTLRVGDILEWFPRHVRVNLYNETKGFREEVILPKTSVAIIENPLYSVMNEPNSTLQRLVRKIGLLDVIDEQIASGKLDLIIQLPYVVRSDARKHQAEARRNDIEFQLRGSQYGIAYLDGTEKITQLNRPAENNLLAGVEYLTNLLYNQLGLTEQVMNGTADEAAMTHYFNRTVKPILDAIVEAMRRTFIGIAGVNRDESVMYFRDPFKYVSIKDLAEIFDVLGRNEVASSNEMRGVIGLPPSTDPKADELRNSNMPQPEEGSKPITTLERNRQNGRSALQRVGDQGRA